jgi:hypothetical protein
MHWRRLELWQSSALSGLGMISSMFVFLILEPTVSQAVTSQFSVRQQVTSGSVSVAVLTNSTTGYTMDISFQNTPAMKGEVTNSTAIANYGSTTEPTYLFFGSTSAQFAYTVAASSSSDLDPSFKNNGTACNTGTTMTANTCWMGATSTSNYRIINRGTAAATTTATTTLQFKVLIPNNPNPAVTSDFYTATATLTAVTQ